MMAKWDRRGCTCRTTV